MDDALSLDSERGIKNKAVASEIKKLEQLVLQNEQLIEQSRQLIQQIQETHADTERFGLSKISGSTSVTSDNGLVLSAKEKNPSVPGTIANKISQVESQCNNKISQVEEQIGKIVFGTYVGNPNGHILKIPAPGAQESYGIAQNGDPSVYGEPVCGVTLASDVMNVFFRENINQLVRINYIYKKL